MIQKLIQKIQKTHAPIVVGLDPMLSYVPAHIQKRAFEEHGETYSQKLALRCQCCCVYCIEACRSRRN